MQHADPELLSLIALGEPEPPEIREHLAGCQVCLGEVESLREVVDAARVPMPDLAGVAAVPPPPRVWEAIAAATGGTTAPAVPVLAPGRRDRLSRRGRRSRLPGLVAAACLVIGVAVGATGATVIGREPSVPADAATVVASVRLAELPGTTGASGEAKVVRTAGGRRLEVDVAGLQRRPGFYEVWLIDKDLRRMYPVGVLDGDRATFTLPPGVDVDDFPVVDVSVEPLDGDPTHSGTSVLRGRI